MPKGVSYLIAIAFVIPIMLGIGTQNGCDFAGDTWFFGNTDLHFSFLILKSQIRNLEIGIERKSLGVMNGRFFTARVQRRTVFSRCNCFVFLKWIVLFFRVPQPYTIHTLYRALTRLWVGFGTDLIFGWIVLKKLYRLLNKSWISYTICFIWGNFLDNLKMLFRYNKKYLKMLFVFNNLKNCAVRSLPTSYPLLYAVLTFSRVSCLLE